MLVGEAMAAVEMRVFPSQCGFDLVLEPDAPVLRAEMEIFSEPFNTAPGADWIVSNEGVDPANYVPRDWIWTDDVPHGGEGGALFATDDPMAGDCNFNDQSAVLHLDSPVISIPEGTVAFLVFDHYVATEPEFDGGNIKISVNDGPFELVPAESFRFNPYNMYLHVASDSNLYLIAGQAAFSGVNEQFLRGSWGQSQVALAGVADPGDSVRFRFDFGVDGCTGIDGWYIDNVRVVAAKRIMRGGRRTQP